MRIKGLHIYGFGKLENVIINDISTHIQVIYGENEAGKSTMMAFIHAILFGFPAKNQSELRYEPKKGFKYGGKLTVETSDKRTITIERVAGKAAGEVTVVDDSGNLCSLEEVLAGINKNIYKGIYSFNIMDIQNLKLIDSEQLGGYLFSSGLIGTDQLHQLSGHLTKEQEEQFKPNGRKPVINKLLVTLKEEENTVRQWKQKMEQYEQLQQEIINFDNRLLVLDEERGKLSRQLKDVDARLAIQPVHDELNQFKLQLSNLGDYKPFPVDGITRLEKFLTERTIYHSKCEKLKQDIAKAQKEMNTLRIDPFFLQREETLESLLSERSKYEQAKEQFALFTTEKEQIDKQIQVWRNELRWSTRTDEEILSFDSSLSSKAFLRDLLKADSELAGQKKRLDDQFLQAKEELEQQEERIASLEKEQLPNDKLLHIRKMLQEQSNDHLEKEIYIQEQLKKQLDNQMHLHQNSQDKRKKRLQFGAGGSILLGGAGAASLYIQNYMMSAVLFLLIFTFIGIILLITSKQSGIQEQLRKETAEIAARLDSLKRHYYEKVDDSQLEKYKHTLVKEEHISELLQKERLLLSQSERTYNRIIQQYEEWERDHFVFQEKWEQWTSERDLQHIPLSFIEEAYDKAVQLKAALSDGEILTRKIVHYQESIKNFHEKIQNLIDNMGLEYSTLDEALSMAKVKTEENRKVLRILEELEDKVIILEEELGLSLIQLEETEKRMNHLLYQAGVESEEAYRLKEQRFQLGIKLEQQISFLASQLKQMEQTYGIEFISGNSKAIWQSKKEVLEEEFRRVTAEKQELLEKQARCRETLRSLEEGGTYSDAVQKFEVSKSKLQENARKWAVYATARHLLARTMEYYRTVKLPEVLELASSHLNFLSNGSYVRVFDSNYETKLMVEHKDGLSFEPKELSQATVEQLYISLRFAVAASWSKQHQFPFMMDDSFVNFDKKRTELAIRLMNKLAADGQQLLFFTCHEHMRNTMEQVENSSIHILDSPEIQLLNR